MNLISDTKNIHERKSGKKYFLKMQVSMSFSNNKSCIFLDIIQILHFTQKMFEVSMFKKLITMNLLRKELLHDLFSGVLIFF